MNKSKLSLQKEKVFGRSAVTRAQIFHQSDPIILKGRLESDKQTDRSGVLVVYREVSTYMLSYYK